MNEQLGSLSTEAVSLKQQLETIKQLEQKQYEELLFYKRVRDRVKFASYVELGIGVPCLILGCLPIWTDTQKNIQNLFLGIGSAATISGGVGFICTIRF